MRHTPHAPIHLPPARRHRVYDSGHSRSGGRLMPGPLQVIAVSFGPGADFEGRVLAEVDRLQGRGMLRLLDVLFVAKDEEGTIQALVVGDDEDLGALLASVVSLDGAGVVKP